jgi:hypothetical protein
MNVRKVLRIGIVCAGMIALGLAPAAAQPSAQRVAKLLHATTVSILFLGPDRDQPASCLGMVIRAHGAVAYIATARHCVDHVSAITRDPAHRDPALLWFVTYANGDAGQKPPERRAG